MRLPADLKFKKIKYYLLFALLFTVTFIYLNLHDNPSSNLHISSSFYLSSTVDSSTPIYPSPPINSAAAVYSTSAPVLYSPSALHPSPALSSSAALYSSSVLQTLRRPRTRLIFNNEYLCTSNNDRHILSTKNNTKSTVIVVLSHRKHFKERNLIRNTWGSIKTINNINILAVVFMLASMDGPGDGETDRSKLETERVQFGDLVMGEFVENYRNLTRKSIMAYEWLTSYCREAQIVVKTDDDVVLNIFKLTEELEAWTTIELASSHFWCAVHWTEKAIVAPGSKYRILPGEFPNDIFPKHCAGVGYVTPMGVVDRIIDEISRSYLGRVSTHEDVFMTGIVPVKVNSNNSSQNEPITLVDKYSTWVTYALENGRGDNGQFLMKLLEPPANKTDSTTKNLDEFRKRFGTQIFFLLNHGKEFEYRYQQLWEILIQTFQNENSN